MIIVDKFTESSLRKLYFHLLHFLVLNLHLLQLLILVLSTVQLPPLSGGRSSTVAGVELHPSLHLLEVALPLIDATDDDNDTHNN